jgi:hypothetical protein
MARERDVELGEEAGCRANEIGTQPSALRDRRGERDEDIVGSLFRGAVDQALAKLRELAADLRLHVIDEQGATIPVGLDGLGARLQMISTWNSFGPLKALPS